ncbi:MAG TPA: DUF3299 domain-containing protein [Pseudomonadales bacterium]|nr:DUF3299 domain-containing protein [Pseudomonadales bacterium]
MASSRLPGLRAGAGLPRATRTPPLAALALACALALAVLQAFAADEVRTLRWPELIPAHLADVPVAPAPVDHGGGTDLTQLSPWGDLQMSALLVPELDGLEVAIAGFVVPLNLTVDNRVDEFLLVPYFGACVHVPPPPPNQIIYVTAEPGLDAAHLYEAWTVTGTLQVSARQSALADAGYSLAATGIRLYGS